MESTIRDLQAASVSRLVLAAQAGDQKAYGRLFEQFKASVFAIALQRLRNSIDAEDLVQEVFIKALLKIHQVREPKVFGAWLRSIAHRMSISQLVRRDPAAPTDPTAMIYFRIEHNTPETILISKQRELEVQKGLQRLKEIDRETLIAFHLQGHSLLEMTLEFDAPLGTIKRRLHVARKRLAKEVESQV